ncbi:hypothetical protein GF337_08320 [candidate division KSB1 bacterium]|nr:hypothetical protein [candidate division KSB1 bacterium]
MLFFEFLISFIIALIAAGILVTVVGWRRSDQEGVAGTIIFLFLILLFGIWAGGVWITPFGSQISGIYWAPFVIIGFLLVLVLVAIIPPRRPRSREEAIEQAKAEKSSAAIFGAFFWILILAFIVLIIVRYVWYL